MNLLALQDQLKNFSQDQLVQEMQMPSGQLPQYLLLSELQRRKKMESEFTAEQNRDRRTTVAQDVVTPGGMPQAAASGIAQAMAPKTDMGGNTGAMPQQAPLPSEPQRMAGGGIVALAEGGRVGTPNLVVRNGRQFAQMQDGSLIPLAELGFSEADMAGAGGADLAAPAGGVRQGPIPTQADLDRKASIGYNDGLGIGSIPARLPTPDVLQTGMTSSWDRDGGVLSDPSLMSMPMPDRAPGRQSSQFTGEDVLFAPGSPLAPQPGPQGHVPFDPGRPAPAPRVMPDNAMEQLYAAEAQQRGPRTRNPEVSIREPRAPMVDPTAAPYSSLTSFLFPNAGTPGADVQDFDPLLYSMDPKVSAERQADLRNMNTGTPLNPGADLLPPAPAVDPNAPAAPDDVVGSTPAPAGSPAAGGGGGGGGGMSMSASASGPVARSDFESQMLGMLEAREKRAQQDKWLALAQAGLALMSSSNPTFGGAIGEAGQSGLAALNAGRESADDDRFEMMKTLESWRQGQMELALKQQALAARARGGGGGGSGDAVDPFELSTGNVRLLDRYGEEIEALTQIVSGAVPVTEAQRLQAAQRLEAVQEERANIIRAVAGVPFAPAGSGGGGPVYDVTAD